MSAELEQRLANSEAQVAELMRQRSVLRLERDHLVKRLRLLEQAKLDEKRAEEALVADLRTRFDGMNEEEKQFRAALVMLCKKHRVRIGDGDHYDGEENYCGTTYYFWSDNIVRLELAEVQDEVNEASTP